MLELRSVNNCWHLITNDKTACEIPPAQHVVQSPQIHTCTTEQYEHFAHTNQVATKYYSVPGTLCQRCLKFYRPDLYKPRNTKEDRDTHNAARDTQLIDLNAGPEDYELIKNIGYDTTRYHALAKLTPIVQQLQIPARERIVRRPLTLRVPTELDTAIRQQREKTGASYIKILTTAIRLHQQSEINQNNPSFVIDACSFGTNHDTN